MTEFIGAEYLIAKMLIEKKAKEISTLELNQLGICVRRLSAEEGVNVVFLTSRDEVRSAIFDYSDYFECVYNEENFVGIRVKEEKSVEDLTIRFIKYLPENIANLLDEAVKEVIPLIA